MQFNEQMVLEAIDQAKILGCGISRDVYEINESLVVKVSEAGTQCKQLHAELHMYGSLENAGRWCTWVGTTPTLLSQGILVAERVTPLSEYLDMQNIPFDWMDDYDMDDPDDQYSIVEELEYSYCSPQVAESVGEFFDWCRNVGVYDLHTDNLGVRPGTNQVVLLDLGYGSESTGGLLYTGK